MARKVIVGLIQEKWEENEEKHKENILKGVQEAASQNAQIVFLMELSLHRYFGDKEKNDENVLKLAEELGKGPTHDLCKKASADNKVFVVGSLFEKLERDGKIYYFNTAVIYNPQGELHKFTRKQHIPSGTGYNETFFFQPGDSDYPVHDLGFIKLAVPTCYDQWFPELARIYALKGAELIIYPTAIGSEPNCPELYTQPMWQTMMVSHAIANGVFVGAVNRIGNEGLISFYGSSFICSPTSKIIQQAPKDLPKVLVATLDFEEFDFWRKFFPLLQQRQPTTYGQLTVPTDVLTSL